MDYAEAWNLVLIFEEVPSTAFIETRRVTWDQDQENTIAKTKVNANYKDSSPKPPQDLDTNFPNNIDVMRFANLRPNLWRQNIADQNAWKLKFIQ